MATKRKIIKEVEGARPYLQGVAKNLVDRIYGPAGPVWGTKFTELEEVAEAIRKTLMEKWMEEALSRQALHGKEEEMCKVCPDCNRPLLEPPELKPKEVVTNQGDPVNWDEPKTRCKTCRRDFFPSKTSTGT